MDYVRFEFPDLHVTSRLKIVPTDKAEGYIRKGLNMYGGVLALDTASSVVSGRVKLVYQRRLPLWLADTIGRGPNEVRSEEHTSELQSLMRISYAVFCLKKKTNTMISQNRTGYN